MKLGWVALAGVVVAAGVAATAVRTMRELFEAIEWDEDPFDEIMDTEDLMNTWASTLAELEAGHFDPADALVDGEAPDVLMVGYGLHLEALPAALSGLWKVMQGDPDSQGHTEAIVRAHTLLSQLRILVTAYETYTNLGVMERVSEIDDVLGAMHSLLGSAKGE